MKKSTFFDICTLLNVMVVGIFICSITITKTNFNKLTFDIVWKLFIYNIIGYIVFNIENGKSFNKFLTYIYIYVYTNFQFPKTMQHIQHLNGIIAPSSLRVYRCVILSQIHTHSNEQEGKVLYFDINAPYITFQFFERYGMRSNWQKACP